MTAGGRLSLYVYYRVPTAQSHATRERIVAMQAKLGTRARLLRRPEAVDGLETWMEVYEDVDPGFEARLASVYAAAAIDPTMIDRRHVERFVAFDRCA